MQTNPSTDFAGCSQAEHYMHVAQQVETGMPITDGNIPDRTGASACLRLSLASSEWFRAMKRPSSRSLVGTQSLCRARVAMLLVVCGAVAEMSRWLPFKSSIEASAERARPANDWM